MTEGIAAQVERELARGDVVGQAREKIKHFVFLVKEDRTFDHMFGRFLEPKVRPKVSPSTTRRCR